MTNFLILSSVILVLIALFLVFRVQTLISVLRGSFTKRVSFSNKVNAALFPIVFIIGSIAMFWYSSKASAFYLPESASVHGVLTDNLFWITIGIISVAFFVTHILMFWFSYKYQYSEERKATFYPDNHKLEFIWTIVPAIILTILVLFGYKYWNDIMYQNHKEKVEIEIMGKQFAWQVRYPGKDGKIGKYNFKLIDNTNEFGMDFTDKNNFDDFIPREIHIPNNTPVLLRIRARDVIHSVFLPHFRVKMDAVPGMPTQFTFVPKFTTAQMRAKTGNPDFKYELACTEICGRGHYAMRYILVVDEPEDYKKWLSEQEPWLKGNQDYLAKVPDNLKQFIPFEITPKEVAKDSSSANTADSLKVKDQASL